MDDHAWPPGWYDDPWHQGAKRWFDGTSWTPLLDGAGAAPGPSSPSVRPGRSRALWVLGGIVLVAAVIAGVLVLTRDGDDADTTGPPSAGDGLEITGLAIPADATQPVNDEVTFAPNEQGFVSAQLVHDGITPGGAVVVTRESGSPLVLSRSAEGTLTLRDPDSVEINVSLSGSDASVSWLTVDGEEGSQVVTLSDEQLRQLTEAGGPAPLRRPLPVQLPTWQAEGTPAPYDAISHVLVSFEARPSDARIRVDPDAGACAAVTLSPAPDPAVSLGPVTCSSSWDSPYFVDLYFRTQVEVTEIPTSALTSEESRQALAWCAERLSSFGSTAGWVGTFFTALGVLLAPFGAGIPIRVALAVGGGSLIGDVVARLTTPSDIPQQCLRELTLRIMNDAARRYLEGTTATIPFTATSLDSTYEITSTLAPVTMAAFPPTSWRDEPGAASRKYGPFPVELAKVVATGDLEAKVTWSGDADMDVHVIDPSGAEIYYGAPTSTTGGALDRDQIPGCGTPARSAEHIFWPSGATPPGHYQVFVESYDGCGHDQQVTVTVTVRGTVEVNETVRIPAGSRSTIWAVDVS